MLCCAHPGLDTRRRRCGYGQHPDDAAEV